MPPAVRLSDKAACPSDAHGCPACPHPTFGPAVNGSPDVMINKLPAIRLDDPGIHMACCGANQWQVAKGSSTIYVNGKPLARMGDKTKHCGGNGALIMGSPNVFADDGGLKSLIAKLLKAAEFAAAAVLEGQWNAKGGGGGGSWDGKGGAGGNKGNKAKGGGQDDKDLSKDADDETAKKTGGLLKVRPIDRVVKIGSKVRFSIDIQKGTKGPVKVTVTDKKTKDKVFETSVTPKAGSSAPLKGSFKAPGELPEGAEKIELTITAQIDGFEPLSALSDTIVNLTGAGVVFALYVEITKLDSDGSVKKPTNQTSDLPAPLLVPFVGTAKLKLESGDVVTRDLEFIEGFAVLDENMKLAATPGPGEAYPSDIVDVELVFDLPEYVGAKVVAFRPPSPK